MNGLLESVLPQVEMVVVVDNGSSGERMACFEQRQYEGRLDLILMGYNIGVAAAQNRGIRRAQELGCSHVLLLDQDSIPATDMVAKLLEAEGECIARGERVGAVGPRFIDPDTGHETWFHGRGLLRYRYLRCASGEAGSVVRADLLIASGMLIRRGVLDVVGLMDETLFIDMVDTEWCLRAAAAGYGIFGVCNAIMQHSIGNRTVTAPVKVGRRGTFPVHKPLRYYYMVRNSLLLGHRANIPLWWKVNNVMDLLFLAGLVMVAASYRREALAMALKGIRDGLKGRTGPYVGVEGSK